MTQDPQKRKWSAKRIITLVVVSILLTIGIFLYVNFNRLISDALVKSFNSGIASDVYELKFENLSVNPFTGTIQVYNVTMLPHEKPDIIYPYINSTFELKTEKLILRDVELFTLLRFKQLKLKIISITKPDVELTLRGKRHIFLPFKDTTSVVSQDSTKAKFFESFKLDAFHLIEAAVHIASHDKQRDFSINNFTISVSDLLINAQPGEYASSFNRVLVTIGRLQGNLKKDDVQSVDFKAFNFGIDSLQMKLTLDSVIYRFHDFTTGLHKLDVQTADSLFHLTTGAFTVSYRDQSVKLKEISFIPNVSHAVLQEDHKFEHVDFSGTIKKLEFNQVNFDSLIYSKSIFIQEILLDSVALSIFKDKTKPLNKDKFPAYLGQSVRKIKVPVKIDHLRATHVELENTERKLSDSTLAKVRISRATVDVKNITNLSSNSALTMNADAWLMNKARFRANLAFYYSRDQFDFEGSLGKFDMASLTPLIRAYTPAKINKGIADEISFSGVAQDTYATGTMKFLYHDLEVDMEFKDQARWKSSVVAFAANTVLDSSNPSSPDLPPKVVTFNIQRDMNRGFVNVVIKSVLDGLKETVLMSKENRKAYKQAKKELRRKSK
jgi:hypothetical protein